jgi:hypothetical protein
MRPTGYQTRGAAIEGEHLGEPEVLPAHRAEPALVPHREVREVLGLLADELATVRAAAVGSVVASRYVPDFARLRA